ncbi:MAG: DUF4412 domain-containing protein [candidate division WOR-3 bacterium]|nr:DUF4412 domain-containing protein [candidate division WOR-3 bacterium]
MKLIKTSLICLITIINLIYADIVMTAQMQDLTKPKEKPLIQTTYLSKECIRIDAKAEKLDIATIFRGDKEIFWIIDNKKKSYTELTKEDLAKMQEMMKDATSAIEQALKNLPSDQRKKMEEMMKKQTAEKTNIVFKKVSGGEKVNQWLCDKYVGSINDQKVIELWSTDWEKIGLKLENIKVFDKMKVFFEQIAKDFAFKFQPVETEKRDNMYWGVPIKIVEQEKGKLLSSYEIKEIRQEELSPSLFEPPKGYKKEKLNDKEKGE